MFTAMIAATAVATQLSTIASLSLSQFTQLNPSKQMILLFGKNFYETVRNPTLTPLTEVLRFKCCMYIKDGYVAEWLRGRKCFRKAYLLVIGV